MSLKDALKAAMGKSISYADEADELKAEFVSTGLAGADWALGGGIAKRRLSEVFGPYGVGKTLLLQMLFIQNQKAGGENLLCNMEEAFDFTHFAENLGGDPSRLMIFPNPDPDAGKKEAKPKPVYLEDAVAAMQQVMRIKIESGASEQLVLGWDGIAASIPNALDVTNPESHNMKHHLARAQAMSHVSPMLLALARQSDAVIIATNQSRESPDPFERETKTTGGSSWPFCCSQRIELEIASQITNDEKVKIGRFIRGKVVKNRVGDPWRRFIVPIYVTHCKHPIYETEVKPGPHFEEALWVFLAGDANEFFLVGKDGKPFLQSCGGGGYYQVHADLGVPGKFRRSDWIKVLADNPKLWEIHKSEAVK